MSSEGRSRPDDTAAASALALLLWLFEHAEDRKQRDTISLVRFLVGTEWPDA